MVQACNSVQGYRRAVRNGALALGALLAVALAVNHWGVREANRALQQQVGAARAPRKAPRDVIPSAPATACSGPTRRLFSPSPPCLTATSRSCASAASTSWDSPASALSLPWRESTWGRGSRAPRGAALRRGCPGGDTRRMASSFPASPRPPLSAGRDGRCVGQPPRLGLAWQGGPRGVARAA